MKVKIYRGTKEIGGTCIEVQANNGKIIWIDLGLPLDSTNSDINYCKEKVDAILISHPHQDHYGLINKVDSTTPVYIGQIGLDFINAVPKFVNQVERHENNFKSLEAWKTIIILNTFKITPYLTDHSTPECFSFLIEVDGKRIFYSGDFRATGRKRNLFDSLIKQPPKNIDILFMEGTMINRSNYKYNDENSIEEEIVNTLNNQTNTSFLISSAQNIDRLISCYRACKKTGKYLVIDAYTAWLLEQLKKVSNSIPTVARSEIKIYCSQKQLEVLNNTQDKDFLTCIQESFLGQELFDKPENYLYFTRCPNSNLIDRLKPKGQINIMYSQWKGYLEKEHEQWFTPYINKLIKDSSKPDSKINLDFVHTSGHAKIEDLIIYAKAMKAKKLIPIHTAFPKAFKDSLEKEGVQNIELWKDNLTYNFN